MTILERRRRIARVAALVVCTGLATAGCVDGLLQSDAPVADTYRLGVATGTAPATAAAGAFGLVVVRPRSSVALDTTRIAIAPGGSRFDYYTDVRWAEPAPSMLQQNLVAALEASGRFAGVLAAPARAPAELMLDVELRSFEATGPAPDVAPTVHVQVQASLVDTRRALRVTSFVSEARVAADANRRAEIIAAFERANAQVVTDVVQQVAAAAATLPSKVE